MLRRKPTALTITTEDIAAFEDALSKNALPFQQQKQQQKGSVSDHQNLHRSQYGTPQSAAQRHAEQAAAMAQQQQQQQRPEYVDPNDELKPLPGERARIVRTREERIMGRG